MRETLPWTSVCRFHGDCTLGASALEQQSLGVRVPARPLRVGWGQWRGDTWFGCPLSSSVRSRGSELRLGFSHTAQRGPFTDAATPSEAGTSASLLF